MPMHDWSRVPAGLFHHFHQDWTIEIARTLNRGLLPEGLTALVEQRAGRVEADVLAVEYGRIAEKPEGGVTTLERPMTQFMSRTTREVYAKRANRIVVKHHLGRTLSVIEIVSPGNKDSRAALRDFVDKSIEYLERGIHLLIVDLLPPTRRDPFGIHKVIWDEYREEDFTFPAGKNRIAVSYEVAEERRSYAEVFGVGDLLPSMPLFLGYDLNVRIPLEATYRVAWEASGKEFRKAVETGVMANPEE